VSVGEDRADEVEGLGVALLQPPLRLSDAALALAPPVRLPRADNCVKSLRSSYTGLFPHKPLGHSHAAVALAPPVRLPRAENHTGSVHFSS